MTGGERMSEKPLHVRVAEALASTRETNATTQRGADINLGFREAMKPYAEAPPIPRYDTDWSATGPLIERFKIDTGYEGGQFSACVNQVPGLSWEDGIGWGATPLVAICHLILALHEAGKLPK